MSVVKSLVDFAVNSRLEDIPDRTVRFTKYLLAKITASMVKGSTTESASKLIQFVAEKETRDASASLIGCGLKSNLEETAFANGYFAHAAELEDDQFPSSTSDITVIPVVFSMIEKYGLSGRNVLEATILGLEIMNRIGMHPLAAKGFVELPFYGVIGACVSAGKALELRNEEMMGAIGIAMGRASGLVTNFGTDAHYIESALACRDGLLAALLAKGGMSGNPDVETWLANLLGPIKSIREEILRDLGKTWRVHNIWIKKYPCCFITHRPIDILFKLKENNQFDPSDVAELLVEDNAVSKICDRPSPVHTDDARFSYQQALSAALLDGDVDNHHFDLETINSPRFVSARKNVKVVIHEEWPRAFLSGLCRLTVTLKNGKQIKGETETAGGAPDSPLSEEQVFRLFKKILEPVMNGQDIDWTWGFIQTLESQSDLRPFIDKLARSSGRMRFPIR